MSSGVELRILGPLDVRVAGQPVPLTAGKVRTVLAALLLRRGQQVSFADLAEKLWDDDRPVNARGTVAKYVLRLRQALSDAGVRLRTEADGYSIDIGTAVLDLDVFERWVAEGGAAVEAADPGSAARAFGRALDVWRAAPPLADVDSEALRRGEIAALTERYLQVCEMQLEAELELGRYAEVARALIRLIRGHPFHETFWALRVRALYGAGRQAEALAAYREAADLLRDELGVDPGPDLRAAHEHVLRQPPSAAAAPAAPPPRQLPPRDPGLVGRGRLLDELAAHLAAPGPHLLVLTGVPGVGKTALAVAAAHRVATAFPDGQLFAGIDDGGEAGGAWTTDEVVAYLLRSLGVPPDRLPAGLPDAVALYRTLTAGRRVLVVLDGVTSAAQVRAAMPGSDTCAVLVTSRAELPDLLVAPGGRRVGVERLSAENSRRVLARRLGPARLDQDADATGALVAMCAGIPLRLRYAAAILETHPELPIRQYVENVDLSSPARDAG